MNWPSACSAMSALTETTIQKRRLIHKYKLNSPADDTLNIILAALAAGLCAAIDYVLEEGDGE